MKSQRGSTPQVAPATPDESVDLPEKFAAFLQMLVDEGRLHGKHGEVAEYLLHRWKLAHGPAPKRRRG